MNDPRLRELERAWKSSRSVTAETALLEERLRQGDLARDRLELAASCGHAWACETTGLAANVEHVVSAVEAERDFTLHAIAALALTRPSYETWRRLFPSVSEPAALWEDLLELASGRGERGGRPDRYLEAKRQVYGVGAGSPVGFRSGYALLQLSTLTTDALDTFPWIARSAIRASPEAALEAARSWLAPWALGVGPLETLFRDASR